MTRPAIVRDELLGASTAIGEDEHPKEQIIRTSRKMEPRGGVTT